MDGEESSWMSTWTGGDKEEDLPNLRGNIGDWSSFMIAMDDNDGQELHRSLSSINIKLNQTSTNSSGSSTPTLNSANTSFSNLNKLKGSGSVPGSPNALSPLKGSLGLNKTPSSPTLQSNPPNSPPSNPNRPMIGTNKTSQPNSSAVRIQYTKSSISSLAASIHFEQINTSPVGSPNMLPSSPLSSSPHNIPPKISLAAVSVGDGNTSSHEDDDILSNASGLEMSINSLSNKVYEGWMEVCISKKWKRKWFVLRDSHLEYYKGWWEDQNQITDSDECGRILLNYWYSFSKITFVDGKHNFSIIQSSDVEKNSGKNNSKLKFRIEDETIAKKWIEECEKIIKRRKETTVTLRPLAEHKIGILGRGRSNTVVAPNSPIFEPPVNDGHQTKVCVPHEMVDCLEPDEKILLEKVKALLDEFKPKPLPEGETPTSYRNKPKSSDGYYRVLSLDGGGLRSVMVCILIERIAKRYPKFLDHVDVFTGTSAGSIVAAGLAFEYPPKGTRRVLELTALPVFGKKRPGFNMGNAKYFARVLRASCYVFFQDRRFYEAQRKLVVPAFQLDSAWPPEAQSLAPEVRRWQPRVFHNIGKCEGYLETDIIGDVLLRSASAPTYFPSHQGYIDGGVFANNPSLSAISLAMSPSLDNIPADKIICLSIGTGASSHYMEGGQDYDWGLLNWAPKLGNLLMGSQVDYLTQICDNILGDRHHRLNPILGENTSMDDPKLVTELATLANTIDLTKTFEFIEKYFVLPEDKMDEQPLSPRSASYFNSSTGSNLDSPRNVSPRNASPRNISPRNTQYDDTSIPLTPR
ncbi:hypothetical protein DICPUDRAFT_86052 [Dictyostelium purpureum]|uniref:PNPLA domain-containing protein n=1 Tax=Dictyostelium purpureum TaxID=5786 RepID=F0Z945_DICPU|nr:uncharacterized protein DICPUDRAFT_86052 [Dictyostelium purpureum]EGC39491.1 hypothetical protein DICPUDRAFT_86052 [Dictyostelium purpureum]|eukprot:XP_003283938.1 hypothetical protein DICPUDRAFT_86052 [Dictyostelium purpureum]